jgi:YesN/AraC family two-component response regulator
MPMILIVEDSNLYRRMLRDALHYQYPNMEILEASNGQEAFEKISASPPDLIFMDIKLPGENGLELTQKIKARYPKMVIIILTSYDLPEYREAAYQYNADHFLSKGSTSKEDILKLVDSILSDRPVDRSDSKGRN